MSRSKSKLIYLHRSQFKNFLFNPKKKKLRDYKYYNLLQNKKSSIKPYFFLWKRGVNITNNYLNNTIGVYNGKFFLILNPKIDVKGFKFGELGNTRKKPKHSGKQRQKKKIKKIK